MGVVPANSVAGLANTCIAGYATATRQAELTTTAPEHSIPRAERVATEGARARTGDCIGFGGCVLDALSTNERLGPSENEGSIICAAEGTGRWSWQAHRSLEMPRRH